MLSCFLTGYWVTCTEAASLTEISKFHEFYKNRYRYTNCRTEWSVLLYICIYIFTCKIAYHKNISVGIK